MNEEPGVWGIAGHKTSLKHYCINKRAICSPESRVGPLLVFPLPNWDEEHPETCPKCLARIKALRVKRASSASGATSSKSLY